MFIHLSIFCQPYEAIQVHARDDQTILSWTFDNWDLETAASTVVDQEVAIVFVNSDSGEVYRVLVHWLIADFQCRAILRLMETQVTGRI